MRCLSVIIPCYNEEATIKELLSQVLFSPFPAEVIVVDDGSVDATAEIAASMEDSRLQVLRQPHNQGKGAALRRGFDVATAVYVIVRDPDLKYDPAEFGDLVEPLISGRADVVFGSRFAGRRASPGPVLLALGWQPTANHGVERVQ